MFNTNSIKSIDSAVKQATEPTWLLDVSKKKNLSYMRFKCRWFTVSLKYMIKSNDNGLRIIEFTASKTVTIKST